MTSQLSFSIRGVNPDVLTCIANLSNDEVFTPPELANRMLDDLERVWALRNKGKNIWADKSIKFLDPCTKSGVFLREITKRLTEGLKKEIPDLQKRVDHILIHQVFGIGITHLTGLLARRSLYCSKNANGTHSITKSLKNTDGNIWFKRIEHSWDEDKCEYCGAGKSIFDRGKGLETHAYALIHTDNPNASISEFFGGNMQFDVIIGNPPYQMTGGGGGTNDSPIYHLFVEQAIKLKPRYLSMVIPSKWMAGGRGLGQFRAEFLRDRRIRSLVDYENAKDIFPTVGIGGGACYFLWDRDNPGLCDTIYHRNGSVIGPHQRILDEFEVFVRDKRAVDILHKVMAKGGNSFEELVSGDTPFGLATNFSGYKENASPSTGQVRICANRGTKRISGSVNRKVIKKNLHLIDVWKLFLPKTGSGRERERSGVDLVLTPSILGEPGSVCTQTYLVAGPLNSKKQAMSVDSYLKTRLVRFLISLRKSTHDVMSKEYRWVPQQRWDRVWSDSELYKMYGITKAEIAHIESVIRPWDR